MAQNFTIGKDVVWWHVNYTSRAKTGTKKRYSKVDGESLVVCSGIKKNRM